MNITINFKRQMLLSLLNNYIYMCLIVASMFFLPSSVNAVTCTNYVSPTVSEGTVSWSMSSNVNTPTDAKTAFANAVAGNVVCFRDGTYNVPICPNRAQDYFCSYYMPAHSGSSDSPIIFKAYPGETPVMNGIAPDTTNITNCGADGCRAQNLITIENKSSIIIDGFVFQVSGGVDMASMVIVGNEGIADYNTVQNCTFNGGSTTYTTGGHINRQGLFSQRTNYTTILHNKFYNYKEASNNHNTSAIKTYWTTHLTIDGNEFYNNTLAIYPKNGNDYAIYRNNFIHSNYMGVLILADAGNTSSNWSFYNNVSVNNTYSQFGADFSGLIGSNNSIYNNTFYGTQRCLSFADAYNWQIYNNIMQCSKSQYTGGNGDSANNTTILMSDYNNFGSNPLTLSYPLYISSYTSLSTWQASGSLTGGGHPDLHSIASDPKFTNVSGSFSKIEDFDLQANSPCKGTGKKEDGKVEPKDMGAKISLVGFTGGSVAKPNRPINLN
jgi:hypothetical protein